MLEWQVLYSSEQARIAALQATKRMAHTWQDFFPSS